MAASARSTHRPVILVVGGGYVGLYTALRLQKKLSRGRAEIVVVDPQPHMTYQPFLPEAAAGSVEPRHVVVPLRRTLNRCRVITGAVTGLTPRREAGPHRAGRGRRPFELSYDVLVMAAGSVARTLPIPGLAEHGIGFKNVGEAIYLRNHVLARLDAASSTDDPAVRTRALTFTFVGGGYAGHRGVRRAGGHGPVRDRALLPAAVAGRHALGAGRGDRAGSCPRSTWTWAPGRSAADRARHGRPAQHPAGVGLRRRAWSGSATARSSPARPSSGRPGTKPNPMLAETDLPLDDRGRVRVRGHAAGARDARRVGGR